MASERITVTLPSDLAKQLKAESERTGTPVSQLVAEALRRKEAEALRERMKEGYTALAEENKRIAEEWLPVTAEVWPDD